MDTTNNLNTTSTESSPSSPSIISDTNSTENLTEIMYMLTCYFYIHASELGYKALQELNPNFVILNNLSNPEIAQNKAATEKEVADVESTLNAMEDLPIADIMAEPVQAPETSSDINK